MNSPLGAALSRSRHRHPAPSPRPWPTYCNTPDIKGNLPSVTYLCVARRHVDASVDDSWLSVRRDGVDHVRDRRRHARSATAERRASPARCRTPDPRRPVPAWSRRRRWRRPPAPPPAWRRWFRPPCRPAALLRPQAEPCGVYATAEPSSDRMRTSGACHVDVTTNLRVDWATEAVTSWTLWVLKHLLSGNKMYETITEDLISDSTTRHHTVHSKTTTFALVFSALHGMPARTSDEKGVCLSVRLSNACIVTKRKKDMSGFLNHTKYHLAYSFLRRRMVGGGRPLLPEILGQPVPVGPKSPILNRYSLVALQP